MISCPRHLRDQGSHRLVDVLLSAVTTSPASRPLTHGSTHGDVLLGTATTSAATFAAPRSRRPNDLGDNLEGFNTGCTTMRWVGLARIQGESKDVTHPVASLRRHQLRSPGW